MQLILFISNNKFLFHMGQSGQSVFSSVSLSSVPHIQNTTNTKITCLTVSSVHHSPVPDF